MCLDYIRSRPIRNLRLQPGLQVNSAMPLRLFIKVRDSESTIPWAWNLGPGGAALVLGHEVGHHICGHTAGGMARAPLAAELEADRYLGAAVREFETSIAKTCTQADNCTPAYTITDIISAAKKLYPTQATRSHPAQAARIAALMEGYNSGSSCEPLAHVKPEAITDADIKTWRADHSKQCDVWVREWCQTPDLQMKYILYESLGIASCLEKTRPREYFRNGIRFVGFSDVECSPRGRIKKGANFAVEAR